MNLLDARKLNTFIRDVAGRYRRILEWAHRLSRRYRARLGNRGLDRADRDRLLQLRAGGTAADWNREATLVGQTGMTSTSVLRKSRGSQLTVPTRSCPRSTRPNPRASTAATRQNAISTCHKKQDQGRRLPHWSAPAYNQGAPARKHRSCPSLARASEHSSVLSRTNIRRRCLEALEPRLTPLATGSRCHHISAECRPE